MYIYTENRIYTLGGLEMAQTKKKKLGTFEFGAACAYWCEVDFTFKLTATRII